MVQIYTDKKKTDRNFTTPSAQIYDNKYHYNDLPEAVEIKNSTKNTATQNSETFIFAFAKFRRNSWRCWRWIRLRKTISLWIKGKFVKRGILTYAYLYPWRKPGGSLEGSNCNVETIWSTWKTSRNPAGKGMEDTHGICKTLLSCNFWRGKGRWGYLLLITKW